LTRLPIAVAVTFLALTFTRPAYAAPEIHNLSLVLSGTPTSVNTGGFNDLIDQFNRFILEPSGFNSLDEIGFGWLFQAELRYLVRPNVALSAGVGHLKSSTKREYLPLIDQQVDVRAEILTVPVHVGADYYFAPYTQGDFQARPYFGGGVLSNVYSVATFQQEQVTPQTGPIFPGGSFTARSTRDSPGFYLQSGAHMFFAARYSAMVGVIYREAKIKNLVNTETLEPVVDLLGEPVDLDLSGFGVRMSVGIGF
jgi:hypothetical protein